MAEGRVAVPTGGSAGVRREIVRHPGLPAVAEVANADEVEAGADRVEREPGEIDAWVNAGSALAFRGIPPAGEAEADRGSHGMFDVASHAHDPWSWLSIRRSPVTGSEH